MKTRSSRAVRGLTALLLMATLAACGPESGSAAAPATTSTSVAQDSDIAVKPSAGPISFGTSAEVLFTLTAAGSGIAGGRAVVKVGTTTLQATTDATGAGTVTFPAGTLPAGKQTVTVSYSGDARHKPATDSTTITVDPAVAAVALTLTPSADGATAAVAAVSSASGVASAGTVEFAVDGAAIASQQLTDGKANTDIAAGLAIGDHRVTAAFTAANPAELAAASGAATLSITKNSATVTATGHQDTIRYGDKGYFNIAVAPVGAGAGADLSGVVTVIDEAGVVAEGAADASGAASLEFLDTADPGMKNYTIRYDGNDLVASAQADFTIQTTRTSVDIKIDKPKLKEGESGTVVVTVRGTPDQPTGTARVTVDGVELANGALDANAQISATISAVTAGTHDIQVSYDGDVRFEAHSYGTALKVKAPITNPYPDSSAAINADNPCPASAVACVDLSHNRAWLQDGGVVTYGPVPMLSGRKGFRTPAGTFSAYWFDKDHKSSLFEDAPMPNSVFFNGGVAFHAGSLSTQSHGCIHLSNSASLVFFNTLSVGDEVYAFGSSP